MTMILDGTQGITFPDSSQQYNSYYGFKNRIINGNMGIWQRATSATITAGSTIAAGYSTVDRFYVYCTGANVTAARVAGSGSTQYRMQITGAASVTGIGIGQRIEQANSYDMAGTTATLSVDLANSLLTTVTWTAFYANTADTFGTLASPTRTQIATGTFTVNSTVTRYSATINIPAAATTGIEVVFTVGAQISGTWTIGNVQLEEGAIATAFDYRPYGTELMLCQRYYSRLSSLSGNFVGFGSGVVGATTVGTAYVKYPVRMRAAPTLGQSGTAVYDGSTQSVTSLGSVYYGDESLFANLNVASGLTSGRGCGWIGNNSATAYIDLSAEL